MSTAKKNIVSRKSKERADRIFVYGTLRKAFQHKLFNILVTDFEFIGKGFIRGNLFDVGEYPAAVTSATSESQVLGEVYQLKGDKNMESVFRIFDKYEGYDSKKISTSEYIRKRMFVTLTNGKKKLVWVYLYNKSLNSKRMIPHGDYIKHVSKKKVV